MAKERAVASVRNSVSLGAGRRVEIVLQASKRGAFARLICAADISALRPSTWDWPDDAQAKKAFGVEPFLAPKRSNITSQQIESLTPQFTSFQLQQPPTNPTKYYYYHTTKMPATVDNNARLLVTGASGQLGQLVLKHLLDTLKVSPANVVAGSRNPDKLADWAARGVTTRRLDFNDAASVEAAAQGVDRALLISGNDILNRVDGHKAAVTALVAAGVKHILYTSLHNVDNSIAFVKADHADTEAFIRESKVAGYTFLRNGLYFDNDIGSIAGAKHTGKWYSAAKDGKLAGISRDDIALANATALASNDYTNQTYELSGNVGLTVEEIAATVSKAIGKPIEVVHVDQAGLAHGIAAATGFPANIADAFATFDVNTAAGLAGPLADDFKTLTGRDPTPHADWVESVKPVLAAL